MAYSYTPAFIDNGLTYAAYRQSLEDLLAQPAKDEAAEKLRPYTQTNVALMEQYDAAYQVSDALNATLAAAPATTWLVLTEGWCGDAAFNVPMLAAVEKALPDKVHLRFFLRDSYPDFMDAHLTDGGRSIPKLVVLSEELNELGTWGPRPEGLQQRMKTWKSEGLTLKEIIPNVREWYNADGTRSVQQELITLVKSYS